MSADLLAQLATSLTDRYQIDREIGRGGMATVFLARDVKHDRQVALKVLDPELGAVLGAERFLSEIKVTANLQHPNLLPLFDSGEAGGLLFYVMPYVEGETLRARLEREKQLPVDEAIRISVAVANALEYAHSQGVIHRDLKPENILMQAGQPVIADFGIALAVSKAGGARITQTGLSLGTPQYMSPEQATGDRVIDGRSDIYSLAAIAYELLTGEAPHTGTTAQAIIARLLTDRPRSIRSTRSAVPEYVEEAIEHALEKLPADRFATAREFAEALQGRAGFSPAGTLARKRMTRAGSALNLRDRLTDPVTLILATVALGSIVAAGIFSRRDPATAPSRAIRFLVASTDSVKLDGSLFPWPAAISPDGSVLVFRGRKAGKTMLFSLRTDQLEPRPIPGTENASQPTFSPDGQWLAFEDPGVEKKVRLDGSAPIRIADGGGNNGADWTTRDELIVGATGKAHGLSKVGIGGGEPVMFTNVDPAKGERDHLWPIATPDGKAVVFVQWSGALATSRLAIASIADGKVVPLNVKGIRPLAIIDHVLIFLKPDGAVMAVGLDEKGKRATTPEISVLDPVSVSAANNGNSLIFISRGGALVTMLGQRRSQLAWLARDGAVTVITPEVRDFYNPRLSPDGRKIAVNVDNNVAKTDIWVYDFGSVTLSRLTSLESVGNFDWTPDGGRVVFTSRGVNARTAFWSQSVDGGAPPIKLGEHDELSIAAALAPDGKSIVASSLHDNTWALLRMALDPPAKVTVYVDSRGSDWGARFSPDGRWITYCSDESGRMEVFVRSYPDPSARIQVSDVGGGSPVWSRDGTRLLYHSGDVLVAVKLAKDPTLHIVSRDTLFRGIEQYDPSNSPIANFDLPADWSKVLVLKSAGGAFQIQVVPNWIVELRQRLAESRKKQ